MSATAQQFQDWAAKAKTMSVESLRYVIKDCQQAEEAMRTWNPERELFYRDQWLTFADELRGRK